jgi:hypothetical protein
MFFYHISISFVGITLQDSCRVFGFAEVIDECPKAFTWSSRDKFSGVNKCWLSSPIAHKLHSLGICFKRVTTCTILVGKQLITTDLHNGEVRHSNRQLLESYITKCRIIHTVLNKTTSDLYFALMFFLHPDPKCRVNKGPHTYASYKFCRSTSFYKQTKEWERILTNKQRYIHSSSLTSHKSQTSRRVDLLNTVNFFRLEFQYYDAVSNETGMNIRTLAARCNRCVTSNKRQSLKIVICHRPNARTYETLIFWKPC